MTETQSVVQGAEVDRTDAVPDEVVELPSNWVGIKEAAEISGYLPQYVRQLLRTGKIPGIKVACDGGYVKWFVDPDFMAKRKSGGGRTVRTTMRKFNLRMDLENEELLRRLLDDADIGFSLDLAYKPKDEGAEDSDTSGEDTVDEDTMF